MILQNLYKVCYDFVAIGKPERQVRKAVAASNNRDHLPQLLYYCLFVPLIYEHCSSRTFLSWWTSLQHQQRGCNNIPSLLQRTAPIVCSYCNSSTWHNLHILVTAPFCCDRRAWAAYVQIFALWQQATIEITQRDHSIIACSSHIYRGVFLRAYSIRGEPRI